MNKVVKVAGITAALAATLLLGGCNEEKKYNALKMEVVPVMNYYKEEVGTKWPQNIDEYKSALEKLRSDREEVNKKLNEMKELSKDNTNLLNDYLAIQREVEKNFTITEGSFKRGINLIERNAKRK